MHAQAAGSPSSRQRCLQTEDVCEHPVPAQDAMFDLHWHGMAKVKLVNNTGPAPANLVWAASLEEGFGPR